jgi:PKD repeat protein
MNVWICAVANGAAGYTYYPEWLDDWPEADGIVLLADYVGSIGTSNPSRSRVLSHEVGHWLNLKHCWGDSNEPGDPSNCFMDDEVEDTPLTSGWTSCSINGATCGSVRDNVENYMEYSYCAKMFTKGQADRMVAALTSPIAQRNSLWQPANLSATGVAGNDILCLAEFASSLTEVCAGSSISFRDESYHNVQQRTWSFPGGDPATSTEEFPSVVYSTPGTYSVTLSVSDGTNTLEVEKQALITVHNSPGGGLPFEDGFEAGPVLSTSDWVVANPDGDNTFEVTDVAAYTGNYSVRLVNTPEMDERMDRLSSGTFDMSDASSISISYRYAYAKRNATSDDRLRLYVSNNCGTSWSLRQQLRGSNTLNTGGLVGGTFIPDPDQWGTSEANNISSNYHTADFRIRFEFESNGGNSVYLDDININGRPVGLEELESRTTGPRVIPNPANHSARAQITVERSGNLRLEVMDALGRVLATPYHGMVVPGTLQVELPIAQLPTGAYVLRSSTSDAVSSTIFLVD